MANDAIRSRGWHLQVGWGRRGARRAAAGWRGRPRPRMQPQRPRTMHVPQGPSGDHLACIAIDPRLPQHTGGQRHNVAQRQCPQLPQRHGHTAQRHPQRHRHIQQPLSRRGGTAGAAGQRRRGRGLCPVGQLCGRR